MVVHHLFNLRITPPNTLSFYEKLEDDVQNWAQNGNVLSELFSKNFFISTPGTGLSIGKTTSGYFDWGKLGRHAE